jgi:diguanylate cyclase (GGDEF)-like protein
LLLVDVDHFKRCNDQYGHPAGDVVLRELAAVFSQQVRDIDLVTRYGGEEFAVVLPSTPIAGAVAAAERIRRTVEATAFPGLPCGLHVTISVGAAEFGAGLEARQFVEQADAALYRAKDAGRNRSAWHDGKEVQLVSPDWIEPAPPAPHDAAPDALAPQPSDEADTPPESSNSPPDPSWAVGDAWQFTDPPGRDSLLAALDAAILKWRCGGRPFALLLLHVNELPAYLAAHGTRNVRRAIKRALGLARATFREVRILGQLDEATAAMVFSGAPLGQLDQSADLFREALLQTTSTSLPSLSLTISATEVRWGDNALSLLERVEQALRGGVSLGADELSPPAVPLAANPGSASPPLDGAPASAGSP